jgi:hypothetical protein
MQSYELYQTLLIQLQACLEVLQDKPEETPVSTLRVLWFNAAGAAKSVQAAEASGLSALEDNQYN